MDNQSIAYSTKSGKAKDKHCNGCKGKLISGRNWGRHKKEQNHEQFQVCSGDTDCQHCQDFATFQCKSNHHFLQKYASSSFGHQAPPLGIMLLLWALCSSFGHYAPPLGILSSSFGHSQLLLWAFLAPPLGIIFWRQIPLYQKISYKYVIITFIIYIENISGNGRHLYKPCSQCGRNTRTDHLTKSDSKCNLCVQGKASTKSTINFGIARSIGKRTHVEVTNEVDDDVNDGGDYKTISDGVQALVIQNQDEGKEEQKSICAPKSKRQALLKDFVDKIPQFSSKVGLISDYVSEPMYENQVVIQTQGERDQQTMQHLLGLEVSIDAISVKTQKFIKLSPHFTQEAVGNFIMNQKEYFKDLVILAQQQSKQLQIEEVTGIAYISVLLGEATWSALPKMFNTLSIDVLQQVLVRLECFLQKKFPLQISKWICQYWSYLEGQTLQLIRYLRDCSIQMSSDVLIISTAVDILLQIDNFVIVSEVFHKFSAFQVLVNAITAQKPNSKLKFNEYADLVQELQMNQNQLIIEQNRDRLINQVALREWMQEIKTLQASSLIHNSASVQDQLCQFSKQYGPLQQQFSTDLTKLDKRYERTFHEAHISPNQWQLAIAQYAAFKLQSCSKQLWQISSGQGKSRISASIALVLLLSGQYERVYLVFENQLLLKRDQACFEQYWHLNGLVDRVFYHVGLDFQVLNNSAVIFDEADQFIFASPQKFHNKTLSLKYIALTATPDNRDSMGVERDVLLKLGCTLYKGHNEEQLPPVFDITLPLDDHSSLYNFIIQELKGRSVLLYADEHLVNYLIQENLPFTLIQDGAAVDEVLLKNLDQQKNGNFELIVCVGPFGMRGIDYRAPLNGITLLVAASFANWREYYQGMSRVGRYGDPCKRIRVANIPLVDERKDTQYRATLFQFLEHSEKKLIVKATPLIKKKNQPLQGQQKLDMYVSKRQQRMLGNNLDQ